MAKQTHLGIAIAAAAGGLVGAAAVAVTNKLVDDVLGRNSLAAARRVFPPQPCGLPTPVADPALREHMEAAAIQMSDRVDEWLAQADLERVVLAVDGGSIRLAGDIIYAGRASRDWVVLAHEYRGHRRNMLKFAEMYARHGFNVLNVDLRGHGESEGDYITMGWADAQDICEWAGYLVSRFGVDIRIVLHGQSMGAAAVFGASSKNACPQVVAVISDSCGTRFKDALVKSLEQARGLPGKPLFALLEVGCYIRCGFSLAKDNPIDAVRSSNVPTLLIHGAADSLVAPGQAADLYNACAATAKKLEIVPRADHLASVFVDPQRYEETVFDFLDRIGVA